MDTLTKIKRPLHVVAPISKIIADRLSPACSKISVAGSLRRALWFHRKFPGAMPPEIRDIDVVCIPIMQPGLFGQDDSSFLDARLDEMIADGTIAPGPRNGPKWKTFIVLAESNEQFGELLLDITVIPPAAAHTWGMQLAIKTGPQDFSRSLVTPIAHGGRKPEGLIVGGDCGFELHRVDSRGGGRTVRIDTRDEADVFAAYGIDWIDPHQR